MQENFRMPVVVCEIVSSGMYKSCELNIIVLKPSLGS